MTTLADAVLAVLREADRALPQDTVYKKVQPKSNGRTTHGDVSAALSDLIAEGKVIRTNEGMPAIAYYQLSPEPAEAPRPRARAAQEVRAEAPPSIRTRPAPADAARQFLAGLRAALGALEDAESQRGEVARLREEVAAAEVLVEEESQKRLAAEAALEAMTRERDELRAALDEAQGVFARLGRK